MVEFVNAAGAIPWQIYVGLIAVAAMIALAVVVVIAEPLPPERRAAVHRSAHEWGGKGAAGSTATPRRNPRGTGAPTTRSERAGRPTGRPGPRRTS